MISYAVLRWESASHQHHLCLELIGMETFPLTQVSIKTRDCLVQFSENQVSYDLFSFCETIEDGPSAIYEENTQNNGSWRFPPPVAQVCASISLVDDLSGSVRCTCSSGLLHCLLLWPNDSLLVSWPYDLSCGARRLAHRLPGVCIQRYTRCLNSRHTFHVRDIGGMRNFPSPDVLEFQFCLVGLHIGTKKSSSAVAVRPRIAVYPLRSAISNSWQMTYDTSKTGVLQSWLHGVGYDNHKTNIGRCRSECNTVSGLKFPHLSVPTIGHLPQSSTSCQSHDGRRQVRKV
jgi:hypothetical protein